MLWILKIAGATISEVPGPTRWIRHTGGIRELHVELVFATGDISNEIGCPDLAAIVNVGITKGLLSVRPSLEPN